MKKRVGLFLMFGLLSITAVPCRAGTIILDEIHSSCTVSANHSATVYGTRDANEVTLVSGAQADLINFPGDNTIYILSDSSLFTVSRSGAFATFRDTKGTVLRLPATADVQTISFNDQALTLTIDGGQVMLGDLAVTTADAFIPTDNDAGGHVQSILEAVGGNDETETRALISSVLAPGYDAVESPDCLGSDDPKELKHLGVPHIAAVWDDELQQDVFEFYIHLEEDSDRCKTTAEGDTPKQRIEIKTYGASPDYLKGTADERVLYSWKFRLPEDFRPSTSFTHIHQVMPVDGDTKDPLFSLTVRKGSPNKLELIYDENKAAKAKVLAEVQLSKLAGVWVECVEKITVGPQGTYSLKIRRVDTGEELLSWHENDIATLRSDNTFIRPKWGIYRSLEHKEDLRDEAVRFAGFAIEEGWDTTTEDTSGE